MLPTAPAERIPAAPAHPAVSAAAGRRASLPAFRDHAPDFTPGGPAPMVPMADLAPAAPGRAQAQAPVRPASAEARLEAAFRPDRETLASFLVNGLYLFGKSRLLEWDPRDAAAAETLGALGHRVAYGSSAAGYAVPAGGFDRALLLSRAFGHLGDEADREWLKAMHRALRPGGLLLFHVLDRDRAWSLARDFLAGEGAAGEAGRADIAFDPATGRVTARLRGAGDAGAPARRVASVRAYNLSEVKALLAGTGFALERAYGDWTGEGLEAGERTGRILVVAAKPRRKARLRAAAGRPHGKGGGA